ncbi:MAG: ATP-binding protein [Candidatus Methanoplasma sp.]|jgi:AAA+ ATPase superfamily predicted ATPase|nr:ATP-binding protein [Candidatus Methanoplasma sp.]
MAAFIGRKEELRILENRYSSEKFEFAAIYGRRRVGKTTLIEEFAKGRRAILFQARERSYGENLDNLKAGTEDAIGRGPPNENMDSLLERIFNAGKDDRLVFVIDEYPYLAESHPSVSSILQDAIDRNHRSSKVFLILCGSSMSFMESQVLGEKSPLYGRATSVLRIEPFNCRESGDFVKAYTSEDKLRTYGTVGGTPRFLTMFDDSLPFEVNLQSLMGRDSPMHFIVRDMINGEFRSPAMYNSLLSAIAAGNRRVKDISSAARIDARTAAVYLGNLEAAGIIGKEFPVNAAGRKHVYYTIKDNLVRFWFACLKDRLEMIERGRGDKALDDVKDCLQRYMGGVFEEVCREYALTHLLADSVGRWWGSDPETKMQVEMDIVASRRVGGESVGLFGECKFRNEPMNAGMLDELKHRSGLVGGFDRRRYILFSKSGFTKDLTDKAKADGTTLLTVEDLFSDAPHADIWN